MRIAVLGTGTVGQTLATKLASLGHQVAMGSRDAANERAVGWAEVNGDDARAATFADAAQDAELIVNATAGTGSLEALEACGAERLAGKVVLDVANPLDFSGGFPPRLSVANDDSLAEQLQRAFPDARVVKSLNTITAAVMVDPTLVPGHHSLFVAGDDDAAKGQVADLLETFGWPREDLIDLGPLSAARGMEMYLPLWLTLMGVRGGPVFNVQVVGA